MIQRAQLCQAAQRADTAIVGGCQCPCSPIAHAGMGRRATTPPLWGFGFLAYGRFPWVDTQGWTTAPPAGRKIHTAEM